MVKKQRSYNDIAAMDCWLYNRYRTGKRKPNEFMSAMIHRISVMRFHWADVVYNKAALGEADPDIMREKERKYPHNEYYYFVCH